MPIAHAHCSRESMRLDELQTLARLYAIELSYTDAGGKRRRASRDALTSLLHARSGNDDLRDALRARRQELESRVVEPVVVAWEGRAPVIAIHPHRAGTIEYTLTLESGDRFAGRIEPRDDRLLIPHELPFGYHTLQLTIDGQAHETLLMSAPQKAQLPHPSHLSHPSHEQARSMGRMRQMGQMGQMGRSWGAFLPLYAARTQHTLGLADLSDLEAYRKWINSCGGGIVATLPMLASFDDEPSPYSPVSRLFWNELYLDLRALPEFRPGDLDERELASISGDREIDYRRANAVKRRVLERMAARFEPDPEFEHFAARASDYAEFREHRERERRTTEGDRPVVTHRYHLYVQYRMAQQMRAVADAARTSGPGLYLDFPLGASPAGYDVWRYGDHFARGASVGAPPDLFFTKGQNWGFPPLDPDAIRTRRHDYFRAAIRHHVEHAGVLRIDHVMGLHRLFWIPEGGQPADGIYVRYPADELYAVLLIEANRTATAIVGEDLGTVPKTVPAAMKKHGLRRMYVVQYELQPDGAEPAGRPDPESVASINTHDMPTFAAFWRGDDIDDRLAAGLLDERAAAEARDTRKRMRRRLIDFLTARGLLDRQVGNTLDGAAVVKVLTALLAWLGSSDAEIVLVNLEDLWLEREPQNVPGMPEQSWRHRLRRTLEEAQDDATVTRILRTLDDKRRNSDGDTQKAVGRSNDAGGENARRHNSGERDERSRR